MEASTSRPILRSLRVRRKTTDQPANLMSLFDVKPEVAAQLTLLERGSINNRSKKDRTVPELSTMDDSCPADHGDDENEDDDDRDPPPISIGQDSEVEIKIVSELEEKSKWLFCTSCQTTLEDRKCQVSLGFKSCLLTGGFREVVLVFVFVCRN